MKKPFARIKQAALLLAACFGAAQAAPTSPQVVAGQATFSQQGNVFSITNTPGTIINWQSFSVNAGEVTRFIQQSSDSAVLNRIVGQDPTRILGALQSNGKVFLINPNGVLFGRDARVDVGGLVASTLNISDSDFLAGKKNFTAGPNAGAVKNEGRIAAANGGQVFLLAPNVENSGVITAPNGDVVLAAGRSVQLVDSNNPDLHVTVSAPLDQAINLGQVVAGSGRIGIYGALVNQRGLVNADSAVVGEGGKIVLKASRDTVLGGGSVTSAKGAGKGGEVKLLGQRVGLDGDAAVDASGAKGGGAVLVGGDWQGKNAQVPNAQQTWFGKNASIRADATQAGDGGKVVLWADGATTARGSISARGAGSGRGGMVETSGHDLDVTGIRVDAGAGSGRSGTWLLDPYDIVVASDGTAQVSEVDLFQNGSQSGETRVSGATLKATNTDIVLQAQHDLTFLENLDTPRSIRAEAGNNIVIKSSVTSTGGNLEFRAANAITLDSSGYVASPGNIDFIAQSMSFLGGVNGANDRLPMVSFSPYLSGTPINVRGAPASGALTLNPAQLAAMSVFSINIGHSGHTGPVSIDNALVLSSHLLIDTAGSININAPVTLSGADSQFVATLHPYLSGALMVHSAGTIETTSSVYLKAGQVQVDGLVKGGSIKVSAGDVLTINGKLEAQDMVDLLATGNIYQIGSAAVWAPRLRAHGATVLMDGANKAGVLAGATSSGVFRFNWLDQLNVGTVDGLSGVLAKTDAHLTGGTLVIDTFVEAPSATTISATSIEGEGIIRGGYLKMSSQDGIGTTTTPLRTSVNVLDAINTASGPTPISIVNEKPLIVNDVVQDGASNTGAISIESYGGLTVAPTSASGTGVKTSSGNISLVTHSPLSIKGKVTSSSGNIRLFADNGGSVSVDANARITTATGNVSVEGGTASIAPGSIMVDESRLTVTTTGPAPEPLPPTLGDCLTNPATPGCGPVLQTALEACIANMDGPNCSKVLPSVETCKTNPNAPGCAVVLQRDALLACIANPGAPGCGAILPTYDACVAAPSTLGCKPVIDARNALNACIANPKGSGCANILPSFETCSAAPNTLGCVPVLAAREALNACIANPKGAGCAEILPSLAQCRANANLLGCAPVLAREAFDLCLVNPTGANCANVLPALAVCKATPSLEGCSQVLNLAFDACLVRPGDPSCTGVLPTLSQCVTSPGMAGCSVVLPKMAECIVSPTLQGCSVILPKLEQCAANPNQQGCEAVLPKPDFCATHPTDPTCAPFNPGTDNSGKAKPADQVVRDTVNLIELVRNTKPQEKSPLLTRDTAQQGGSGSDKPESTDATTGPVAADKSGVKNEKPATKMYCN